MTQPENQAEALIRAGKLMANILFNIEQRREMSVDELRCIKSTREEWDHAIEAWNRRASLPEAPAVPVGELGWIVGNGAGTMWRKWTGLGPVWVEDRDEATRYARRVDAEAVHEADEDAWTVQWYSQTHDWFEYKGMKCCRVCSLVWNETSDNRPCKGPHTVGLRSALQSSPPVTAAVVDGEKLAEIMANVDQWQKWAFEWSGSAFVSGEDLPEGGEAMSEAEHKTELYSGLCKLGNHMAWLHDEIAALASQHAVEGAVAQWQVWVEPDEDEAIVTGWVDEDADMIEHWRSKGRRVRPLYARPAAADAGVREALVNLAHEMRFLLRQNPDKDGGLYRQRLDEADAALALAKGECPHRCDEGGVCLAEHSGFPQSCPRAALSLAAKRGQTNG